ncbi:MAG: transposase [Bryobacteraceae bacterium]
MTDGCPGLAAAIQMVYPRVQRRRCWVHKMRNILDKLCKRDYEQGKADAQAMYLTPNLAATREASDQFQKSWRSVCPSLLQQRERALPELLSFFRFPKPLWR